MSHLAICNIGIKTENLDLSLVNQACALLEGQGYTLGTRIKNKYVDETCLISFSSKEFPTGIGVQAASKGFKFVSDPYGYQEGHQKAQTDFRQAYFEAAAKHVLGRMGYAVMRDLDRPRLTGVRA